MLIALIMMLVTLGKDYARNADRKPIVRKAKPEPIWLHGQAEPRLSGEIKPQPLIEEEPVMKRAPERVEVIDRKRQRDLDYQMVSSMFKEEAPRVPQRSIDLIREEQMMQQKAEEAKDLKAAQSVSLGETPFTSVSGSVDKVQPKV
jgi:hypothetical protein